MEKKGLRVKSKKYLEAARIYAETGSIRETARRLGISESTLYLWRQEEEFQQWVNYFNGLILNEIKQGIISATREAIQKLNQLLHSKEIGTDEAIHIARLLLEYYERILEESQKQPMGFAVGEEAKQPTLVDLISQLQEEKERKDEENKP